MAYLTASQRADLQRELEQLSFRRANGRLKRMDPMGRMAYYRNAQNTGEWTTKHILAGLGTQVTLVEVNLAKATDRPDRVRNEYTLADVIVEATPDNRN
ncbi:MAG: hypothetical protein OXF44_12870 [Anaerolineaceae bacterium]|nr:hypothetical protein [Anaerolineaceae bacterium]MCY4024115.1 hypothetical protein [Anaerolineaceae bacterium]